MGLRWRKSFSLGPFRWTLSRRGIGQSVGGRGLRIGRTPSGRSYISLSLPGTGLSYIHYFGGRQTRSNTTAVTAPQEERGSETRHRPGEPWWRHQ